MPRPPVEVADVIRTAGESFFECRPKWFSWLHLKVLHAILCCRTAALGGHTDACSRCGHEAVSFNSCRNRHCPKCQANAPRSLARSSGQRTAAHPLRPRRLHLAATTCAAGIAEQTRDLWPVIPGQRRDPDGGRPRSPASRRRDRVLQRPPYLESETPSSSPRSLCGFRRWPGSAPLAVDRLTAEVLPTGRCTPRSVPGQVRGRPPDAACRAQTRLPRNPRGASETQSLRSLASSAVPLPLGGLCQTSIPRCATRATVSRPVHPWGGHFQPSTRLLGRWQGRFSLARFRSPQQEASDDAARERVLTKIPVARAAAWIRPHPLFRLDGSSTPRGIAPALLATARPIRSVSRS